MEESDTERGTTVRIFVGGLGESVKEDELRNIFGSFGSVQGSVDIIRTKGRSFAYCDFIPSSPNCLTKLFGIYNGCVWKGGRLKLEKAKEHFLIRLKREWEEDSAPPENAVDVSASVEEPKKVLDPSGQIKLFIPRLRKVKSLPLKGTGKHKYSFQRYNAPIVPKHFCDCEEHSGPPEPFKEQTSKLESLNGGMDSEEINLMNSVMNKLLEKEIRPKVVENVKNAAVEEKEVSVINSDKLQEDESMEEDLSEEDMDDLVTNIVTTSRTAAKKVLRSDRAETSKDGSSRKKPKVEKTVGVAVLDDDDVQINTRATVLGTQPPPEPVVQSRPRSIWSQKSSWKELVGNGKNDTFTVSNILKDTTALKEKQVQLGNDNADEADSSDNESSHDLVEEETEEDDEEDTEPSKSDDSAEEETEEDEDDTDPSKSNDLVEDESEQEDGTSEPSEGDDLVEEEDGSTGPSKGDDLVEDGDDDDNDDNDDDDDDEEEEEEEEEEEDDDEDEDEDDEVEEEEDGTTEPLKRPNLIEETTAEEVPTTEASKTEEGTAEVVTKTSDTYMNSGRGSAWRHQSSWTELLKAKSNMSFSLSAICPSQNEGAKDDDSNLESMQTDKQPSNAVVEEMAPVVKEPKDDNTLMVPRPKPKKVIDGGRSGDKARTEMVAGGEGEVCRFMRSSASMKDWVKSKTALSTASRKRKKKTEGSE